jgi:hypothetical protein
MGEAEVPLPEESNSPVEALTLNEPSDTAAYGVGEYHKLKQYQVRAQYRIARALIGVLALVLIGAGVLLATNSTDGETIKDILSSIVPALVALIGTATAFYYTERHR